MTNHRNRESYGRLAYETLRTALNLETLSPSGVVTYGFTSSANARAECWHVGNPKSKANAELSEETQVVIVIHPVEWSGPLNFLSVLTHEMIHACGIWNHGKTFEAKAKAIGLLQDPDSGVWDRPDAGLIHCLKEISDELPDFPASDFGDRSLWNLTTDTVHVGTPEPPKPQTTRLRKHMCECEQIIRAARDDAACICRLCNTAYCHVPQGFNKPIQYGGTA